MRKLLLLLLLIILFGCKIKDENYFNGTIKNVLDSIERTDVKLLDLKICSDYTSPQIFIHDSLMINYLFSNNDYFFNIVNLKNGNLLGQFCHRGKGNNELLYCTELSNCYMNLNDLKAFVLDSHKELLHEWNISKSVEIKETVFDTVFRFKNIDPMRAYDYSYRINDSILLGYLGSSADDFNRKKPILPAIEIRDIYSDNVFKTIYVFKDTFEDKDIPANLINNNKGFIPAFYYYNSTTDVRPDCKYAVQSMKFLAQLNIINIETGEIRGIRLKDTPDFSLFKNHKNIKRQYFLGGLIATDNFIYAGYSGESANLRGNNVRYIYKFNWDGDIMKVYDLGLSVSQILYNRATNEFYAFDSTNLILYLIKIN